MKEALLPFMNSYICLHKIFITWSPYYLKTSGEIGEPGEWMGLRNTGRLGPIM